MTTRLIWRGIAIDVRSEANWLNTGLTHIEVETTPRTPLPITETGYRSHFINPADLAEYGGAEGFIRQWLEDAAKNWSGQLTLF